MDLKSGSTNDLYASRAWLNMPFSRSISATAQDLRPWPSPDRSFSLEHEGAVEQLRRWASLVPGAVFTNTLEQDLEELEWHFELFLSENQRLPWTPLAGVRLVFGRDPKPVIDAAIDWLSLSAGSGGLGGQDLELAYWRNFRAHLEDGREVTLRWLDEQRRVMLRAEKVADALVESVLDDIRPIA